MKTPWTEVTSAGVTCYIGKQTGVKEEKKNQELSVIYEHTRENSVG